MEKTECLKWKAVKWSSRDIRQREQTMCRDKNSPFDQTASPFYLGYSKQAALTSITLDAFGPTEERWGAPVKHCSPHRASPKSILHRWACANPTEIWHCHTRWAVDCRQKPNWILLWVCASTCSVPLSWGAKLQHHKIDINAIDFK